MLPVEQRHITSKNEVDVLQPFIFRVFPCTKQRLLSSTHVLYLVCDGPLWCNFRQVEARELDTKKAALAAEMSDEERTSEYFLVLQQLERTREEVRRIFQQPEHCLPYMQVMRFANYAKSGVCAILLWWSSEAVPCAMRFSPQFSPGIDPSFVVGIGDASECRC